MFSTGLYAHEPIKLVIPNFKPYTYSLNGNVAGLGVDALPETATICSCFDVSKGDISAAVQGGCCTMGDVKDATKAS